MPLRHNLLAVLIVAIWALNIVAAKYIVSDLPPIFATGLRFLGLGLLLLPFYRPPLKRLKALLCYAGTMGLGHFGILFIALMKADAGAAGILLQLGVPFSVLIARFVFGESFGLIRSLAMALSFSGVVFIIGAPETRSALHIFLLCISACSWGGSNILVKRLSDLHPLQISAGLGLFSGPMLITMSYFMENGQVAAAANAGWITWAALSFIILAGSLFAHSMWFWLLARNPVSTVVPYSLLNPVFSVSLAVLLLGEEVSMMKIIGGFLTVVGVAIIQQRGFKKQEEKEAA